METRDALTNVATVAFVYDSQGRLVSLADRTGNQTQILRDGSGNLSGFRSPVGQMTTVALDANLGGTVNSMTTRWTVALLGVICVGLLIGCALLAYLWIDRSITLGYANQSMEASNRAAKHLESLLESEWRGTSESTILQKLEREAARSPGDKIVLKRDEGGNVIWFDEIRFNFESGELRKIGAP